MSQVLSDRKQCAAAIKQAGIGAMCCPGCHAPDDPRLPDWVREQDIPMFRSVRLFGGDTYSVCCAVWERLVGAERGVFV